MGKYLIHGFRVLSLSIMLGRGVLCANVPIVPDVVTVSLGATWSSVAHQETITLLPTVLNTYVEPRQTDTLFEGEVFVGYQQVLEKNNLAWQLGLTYLRATSAKISGTVWQLGLPQFENQVYTYKINHQHVAVKAKLLQSPEKPVQLYVSGSIGVGFNDAHGFNNLPLIETVVASPNFTDKTMSALSYTLSAGLQKSLSQHWLLGAEYQFVDWGRSELGPASGQTINTGIRMQHLYTNGLQIVLTHLT